MFTCPECHKPTRLIQKTIPVETDVERVAYKCEHCGYLSTVYYSDEALRKLIKKQQKTKSIITRNSQTKMIEKRMSELRNQYEGESL